MFAVIEPRSVQEVAEALANNEGAVIYAGGVQLLADIKDGIANPTLLVSIKNAAELRQHDLNSQELIVGAGLRIRDVATSREARSHAPLLSRACSQIGNPRVRGRGTIGGNMSARSPKSDLAPVLLVHDAVVDIASADSTRHEMIEALLDADGLAHTEVISRFVLHHMSDTWAFGGARRRLLVRPLTSAAAGVRIVANKVAESRLALGGLGSKAVRLRALEAAIANMAIAELEAWATPEQMWEALDAHDAVDDPDASAWFKRRVAAVLLSESLHRALAAWRENGRSS